MNTDLSKTQHDYAYFVPALSGFYAGYVGQERATPGYVDPARIPSCFPNGVESLNFLNQKEGLFYYPWFLYSAGHAELDPNKDAPKEDMIRKRERTKSYHISDSGGYQIGKNLWKADWPNPQCQEALKKRQAVLKWMDAYADAGMTLDVPSWIVRDPIASRDNNIRSYHDAVAGTKINNEYFIRNRNGNCKFLNVLQGETHAQAESWYQEVKKYCDPKVYPDAHFNGWSMGGQNACSTSLMLKRITALRHDGLLEKGKHDNMHFLGTSKLEWAVLMTDVQRAVRKYHNENFMITFDCASPFLATANGQIYNQTEVVDRTKWTYRMLRAIDDKKYAYDNRLYGDVGVQDGFFPVFEDSPITANLKVSDVCVYGPGIPDPNLPKGVTPDPYNDSHWIRLPDRNKIDKIGRTSWDSFGYAIQMGHNIYRHIEAVQRANREYDAGAYPKMLITEQFSRYTFRELVEEVMTTDDRDKAYAIIADHDRFLTSILGTRGNIGKREINAKTYFGALFDEINPRTVDEVVAVNSDGLEENKLDELEKGV